MKKKLSIIMLLLSLLVLWTGCRKNTQENVVLSEGSYKVYYINSSQTGIVWKQYKADATTTVGLVNELILRLSKDQGNFKYVSPIGDKVVIKQTEVNDEILRIDFDAMYKTLMPVEETLIRAAIVKTLTQIEGIEFVDFSVNGLPLKDQYDQIIRPMTANDFIDDDDVEKGLVPISFVLYFANDEGDKLVGYPMEDVKEGSTTIEQLIVSHLIEGPKEEAKRKGLKGVIPKDTILNNVTTKEGVCYVDLSKEFLNQVDGVKDKVTVFSLVNSLIELSSINKVQIMIDGKIIDRYHDEIALNTVLDRDLDLVEGAK